MELSVLLLLALLTGLFILLARGHPKAYGRLPPGPRPLPYLGNRGGLLKSFLKKVYKEIDQVIGSHRPPALSDQTKMPYTNAVICEIQRFSDLVPIGVPRVVIRDIEFRGSIIPKGTAVFPILNSALFDPLYFSTPNTFNPDHFLDANGALKKNDVFIPFSVGKRVCLGKEIARVELFLFFTTILQNFSLASPVAPEDIDLTPLESGMSKPPPMYQIRFLSR